MQLRKPKPPTFRYNYNNPASKGALVCETKNFPSEVDPKNYLSVYVDRLARNEELYHQLSHEFMDGKGNQGWTQKFLTMSDEQLKQFAKIAFQLEQQPQHVRVVFDYSISGSDCPCIEMIK